MIRILLHRYLHSVRGDKPFHRMLTNTGWLLSANSINAGMAFVQSILVARALGVEQYGMLGIVITFVTVVNRLTSFRMNEVIVKYMTDALVDGEKRVAAATLKIAMLVESCSSILAFMVIFALAPFGARWFAKDPYAALLIYSYAFVILCNLVSESATGVLHIFNRFRRQAMLATLGQAVTLGGVLAVFILSGGIIGVLSAYLAGQLVHAGALLLSAIQEAKQQLGSDWWRVSLNVIGGRWRSMAKFAISTNLSSTLSLITKDSDLLWLGYFRNATEVGYYKLAVSLATLVMMPVSPLNQTVYPEITREVALHRWDQVRRLLNKGSFVTVVWILPVSVLIIAMAPLLVPWLYGDEFLPALPALAVLLLGVGFAHTFFWSRPALLALGLPSYPMKVNIAISVLKVFAVISLVPVYGYVGNAAILSALYFFGVGLSVRKTFTLLARRKAVESI